MSVLTWTILYLLTASVWVWLLINRNAYKYSGSSFLVILLRDFWGASYKPETLRFLACGCLIVETLIYIGGLVNATMRDWFVFL